MKKIVIVCGLIAGIFTSAWMLYSVNKHTENMDYENGMLYGYATMLIAFSLIFVGIKNYRDKYNDGTITFGKGFKIGLFITLIASTIYVGSWLIDFYCFDSDFMEKYSAHLIDKMRAEGKPQVEIDQQIKEMKYFTELYKNPLFNAMISYTEILPVGLIISLISAGILKKKPITPSIA